MSNVANPGDTIGTWDTSRLVKFIKDLFETNPPSLFPKATIEELSVSRKLIVTDEIQLAYPQKTVGGAGAASALPATPELYVKVLDPYGKTKLIPLYKVS